MSACWAWQLHPTAQYNCLYFFQRFCSFPLLGRELMPNTRLPDFDDLRCLINKSNNEIDAFVGMCAYVTELCNAAFQAKQIEIQQMVYKSFDRSFHRSLLSHSSLQRPESSWRFRRWRWELGHSMQYAVCKHRSEAWKKNPE